MKRFFSLMMVLFLPIGLAAGPVDFTLQHLLTDLTREYSKNRAPDGVKAGLSVLDFEASGDTAKRNGLGRTLRDLFEARIQTSQLFFLVDRESLKSVVREKELSLTGLTSDSGARGQSLLAGVDFFIAGSVAELNGNFTVTVKLISVSNAETLAVAHAVIPRDQLISRKKELDFSYISQYGLGINGELATVFSRSGFANLTSEGFSFADVYVNYRPKLFFNIKLGLSIMNLFFEARNGIPVLEMFPGLIGATNMNPVALANENVNLASAGGGRMNMGQIASFAGIDYNWTPSHKFSLGIGFSYCHFERPILEQRYERGYLAVSNAGGVVAVRTPGDIFTVSDHFNSVEILRLELKPQYFISPRMTIGLYAAVTVCGPLQLESVLINGEAYDPDSASVARYFGLDPKSILGGGNDVTSLKLTALFMLGGSLNFYF